MRLLMIDNYDSFTHNLVQLFQEFDVEVVVVRHDRSTPQELEALHPRWVCISPGPGDPSKAGISSAVVERFRDRTPVLGVCLGMQVINEVYGGRTTRAPLPVHGKRWAVHHRGEGVFQGLPSPFQGARYHSLQVKMKSPELEALAWCDDGVVMGLRHRALPLCGVQFHPESFLSQGGLELVANFLALEPSWRRPSWMDEPSEDRFPRAAGVGELPKAKRLDKLRRAS